MLQFTCGGWIPYFAPSSVLFSTSSSAENPNPSQPPLAADPTPIPNPSGPRRPHSALAMPDVQPLVSDFVLKLKRR